MKPIISRETQPMRHVHGIGCSHTGIAEGGPASGASSASERRLSAALGLTLLYMVAEVVGGHWTGSMGLLADGWHMATDAGALALAVLVSRLARHPRLKPRLASGSERLHSLAGWTSAWALLGAGGWAVLESISRLQNPVPVKTQEALWLVGLGLVVNGLGVWILHGGGEGHGHHHGGGTDHNHRAAYLHVLADFLTSVTAFLALLSSLFFGWWWADPAMGVLGGLVIVHWSVKLLRDTGRVLVDLRPLEG